jgi:hypothetical protein
MNIIALDIDDSILISEQTYFGKTDDALELLEINLKRLILMCKKWNMQVFIISSWSSNLRTDKNKNLFLKNRALAEYENEGCKSGDLICEYLSGYIFGIADTGKESSIRNLLSDGHKVVTIEDTDFSHIVHKNHLYCKTYGFISNRHSYNIKNFIEQFTYKG